MSTAQVDHESALISSFVLPRKRERLIGLLQNPKRRESFLADLYHFRDLDPRFCVPIAPDAQTPDGVLALLRARGAPTLCHVVSTVSELDGQVLPLEQVLDSIVGFGHGSLISCVAGRLGYFEGEMPKDRWILAR